MARFFAVGGSVDDEDTDTLSLNADLFNLNGVNLNSNPPNLGDGFVCRGECDGAVVPLGGVIAAKRDGVAGGRQSGAGNVQQHDRDLSAAVPVHFNGGAGDTAYHHERAELHYIWQHVHCRHPNASSISSAVLVRNGTVTHAFGMDQRMVGMNFTVGSGSLTVTAPPNSNVAPPGYYMLFILNSSGVPSVAQMVQVLPNASPNGISFIQVASATPRSTATVSATYASAQTAGDLNIVAVGWNDTTSTCSQ